MPWNGIVRPREGPLATVTKASSGRCPAGQTDSETAAPATLGSNPRKRERHQALQDHRTAQPGRWRNLRTGPGVQSDRPARPSIDLASRQTGPSLNAYPLGEVMIMLRRCTTPREQAPCCGLDHVGEATYQVKLSLLGTRMPLLLLAMVGIACFLTAESPEGSTASVRCVLENLAGIDTMAVARDGSMVAISDMSGKVQLW